MIAVPVRAELKELYNIMSSLLLFVIEWKKALLFSLFIITSIVLGVRELKIEQPEPIIARMSKINASFSFCGIYMCLYLVDMGVYTAGVLLDVAPSGSWSGWAIFLTSLLYAAVLFEIVCRFATFKPGGLLLVRRALLCFPIAALSLPLMTTGVAYVSGRVLGIDEAIGSDPVIALIAVCIIPVPWLLYLGTSGTVREVWQTIQK